MIHGGHLIVFAKDMTQGKAAHTNNPREGIGHARKTNPVTRGLGLWTVWYQPDFQEGEQAEDWVQPHGQ